MKRFILIIALLIFAASSYAGNVAMTIGGQTVASGESPVEMAPGDGWQIVFVNGSFVIIIDSIDADDTISF